MLNVRRILLIIALSFCVYAFAESQPAISTPSKSTNQKQEKSAETNQETTKDLRGTYKSPLVVDVISAPDTNKIAERKSEQEGEKSTLDRLTAFSTVALAVITFFLALYTARLWGATDKLVKGAEETAQRQLRAYVHVRRAQASRDNDAILWAKVEIQNFGQTPAYDVVQWIGIVGVSEGDIPNFTNPGSDFKKAKGIIGPGSFTEFLIPTHDKITPQKDAALMAGKATIYVYGEVFYRDVFNIPHVTKFRMFLSGEGSAEGKFKNTEEGNEAT